MKTASQASSTRVIVAVFVVVALAVAFWMLLLAPKREKSDELSASAEQLQSTLVQHQSEALAGEEARGDFATDYQQLVVLGKAVPSSDESSSLLIQLNHVADDAGVKFQSLVVGTSNGSEAEAPAPEEPAPEPEAESEAPAGEESTGVPAASTTPTESTASTLPIGATVGPAGLSILPYDLTFSGSFFQVADFIKGMDSLIHTSGKDVAVDGRLVTLDGFALGADADKGFPHLSATFSVTTYLVPAGQGTTAGASPTEPAGAEEAPSTVANELR